MVRLLFLLLFVVAEKRKNTKTQSGHMRLCARVAMEEGLLSVMVSQSIGESQSVDEYCYLLNLGFASLNS